MKEPMWFLLPNFLSGKTKPQKIQNTDLKFVETIKILSQKRLKF
jgi:hypothetical protein